MKIRVIGHSGESVFPFGVAGPWKEFENTILQRGHTICRKGYEELSDSIIANSYGPEVERYMLVSDIPIQKRVLVNWEPYVVERDTYTTKTLDKFGGRYAPSIHWARRINGKSFNWPQDQITDSSVFMNWGERSMRAVMIQGNKFSARKGELYSLRRRILKRMDVTEMSLFGTNWNSGINFDWWHWSRSALNSSVCEIDFKSMEGMGAKYSNYYGATKNKFNTLSNHQISVVIENSSDFVSEKLFDSVRAGCVSVYVGPNLEDFGIPRDSAICVEGHAKPVIQKVRQLQQMPKSQLQSLAEDQFSSLSSVSKNWNNDIVLKKLASDILDFLEK